MNKISPFPLSAFISEIETDPLNCFKWEKLASAVHAQNDAFSSRSLEIILEGLQTWNQQQKKAGREVSLAARTAFSRLARSYNSPVLLRDIGQFYLQEGNNPALAVKHWKRAQQLGGSEKELRPLLEAASLLLQAGKEENTVEPVELISRAPLQPLIHEMISKSGKLAQMAQKSLPPRTGALARIKRPTASLPSSPQVCLEEAEKALAEGDPGQALLLMEKANRSPLSCDEMWQGWSALGLAFFTTGDYAQAEKAYAEAARYRPEEMTSHFNLGTARHLNQNFSGALAAYHKAEALEPNHPKVWCNLGALFCQQDDYAEAEKALSHAVSIEPTYARAWDNLGVALGAQDRLEEALQASRRAVELKPRYPEASFKIGVIEFSRNNLLEAVEHLQLARELPALMPYALGYLVLAYARMERIAEAQETIQKLIALEPRFEMLYLGWNALGAAWFESHDYAQALEAHRQAAALKPDDASSWYNLGVAQLYHEEPGQARESLQKAIDLQFNFPDAWQNLALACNALGRFSEATAAFQQVARFHPENSRVWHQVAASLEKEGMQEKAQEAYARATLLRNESIRAFSQVAA